MRTEQTALLIVLLLAGFGSALIFSLGLAAFVQRRSRSYFLITLALAVLFIRTSVGSLTLWGFIPLEAHHLVEHSLDAVMAGLLLSAVYYARTVDSSHTEVLNE